MSKNKEILETQEKQAQEAVREILLKPISEKERLKQPKGRPSKKGLDQQWVLVKR